MFSNALDNASSDKPLLLATAGADATGAGVSATTACCWTGAGDAGTVTDCTGATAETTGAGVETLGGVTGAVGGVGGVKFPPRIAPINAWVCSLWRCK